MKLPGYVMHNIIDLAVEDWTPLFDVTSEVRRCMGDRPVDEQIDAARLFVHELLAEGLVKLYYDCHAASINRNKRITEELTKEEMRREMKDRSNWLAHDPREPDERWVTIGATAAGEDAYAQGTLYAR